MIPLVIEQKMDAICKENDELKKEIDRLNNIIDELERFCSARTKALYGVVGTLWQEYQDVLDKLKELKEGNK